MSTRKTRSKRKAKPAATDSIDVTVQETKSKAPAAKTKDKKATTPVVVDDAARKEMEATLRSELKPQIEAALRSELKPQIEAALRSELEPIIRQNLQESLQPPRGETKTASRVTFVGATSTTSHTRPHRRTYQG